MPFQTGNPYNRQGGVEIIYSNLEYIQAGMTDVVYPELIWTRVQPQAAIDTSADAGATFASYIVRDKRGAGAFRARSSNNVPTVGLAVDKVSVPLEPSGVSAIFDRQDEREWELGHGIQIFTELGEIMALAQQRHIEGTYFFGNAAVNYEGFLNNSLVPTTVAVNGASGFPEWSTKTADEIIFDLQSAVGTVWSGSKGLYLIDRIGLDLDHYDLIVSTKAGTRANDETIINFVKKNNVYTSMTGIELEFVPIRYLDSAGAGDTSRMRVYTSDPRLWWMPMPLPFEMLQPTPQVYQTVLPGEYIFGPPHIKWPLSQLNVDGI